jgi:hypothetical protein
MNYSEEKYNILLLSFMIPIHVLFFYLYFFQIGDKPIGFTGFLLFNILFIAADLLLYKMKSEVSKSAINISFGIGIIRKSIPINNIEEIRVVENPWYYGWGIRIIPNGTLYNIGGFKALELKLKNTTRIIRIGTDNQNNLKSEIEKRIH